MTPRPRDGEVAVDIQKKNRAAWPAMAKSMPLPGWETESTIGPARARGDKDTPDGKRPMGERDTDCTVARGVRQHGHPSDVPDEDACARQGMQAEMGAASSNHMGQPPTGTFKRLNRNPAIGHIATLFQERRRV